MSKIKELLDFNPGFYNLHNSFIDYEKQFFCTTNKIIHGSIKNCLNCKDCISELDKIEYESLKRLEWFLDGYFIHNLGKLYSKLSIERICELYNIKINYFKPWLK